MDEPNEQRGAGRALDELRRTVERAEKMRATRKGPFDDTPVIHSAAQLRAVLDEVDAALEEARAGRGAP